MEQRAFAEFSFAQLGNRLESRFATSQCFVGQRLKGSYGRFKIVVLVGIGQHSDNNQKKLHYSQHWRSESVAKSSAMSRMVRAVLLRAGSQQAEWVEIDANASGPELSAVIGSSQPECLTLSAQLVLWYDGTPFSTEHSHLGQCLRTELVGSDWSGDVLIVGCHDPRTSSDDSISSDESVQCNHTPLRAELACVFVDEFVSTLYE